METVSQHRRETTRGSVINNGVLGILIFLATEVMLFGGLISALIVNRAENVASWPPQWWAAKLPFELTAFNTALLLASGVTMFYVVKEIGRRQDMNKKKANLLLLTTMILGALFVTLQGAEWVQLMGTYNLTATADLYGAFFYLIIGAHGIHVTAGVLYLSYISVKIMRSSDVDVMDRYITTSSIYWYFVVGLWPLLYVLVYMY